MYSRENLDSTLCPTSHVSLLRTMRLPTFEPTVEAHGYVDGIVGEVCIGATETYHLHIRVSPYLLNNIFHPGMTR